MSNVSDVLNEWNEYSDGDTSNRRPQWYKMWCEKYAAALDIENLDNDLTPKEKDVLFKEVGKVFINSLFYFLEKDCFEIMEHFEKLTNDTENHFTEVDVLDALEAYDSKWVAIGRTLCRECGLNIQAKRYEIKGNGTGDKDTASDIGCMASMEC